MEGEGFFKPNQAGLSKEKFELTLRDERPANQREKPLSVPEADLEALTDELAIFRENLRSYFESDESYEVQFNKYYEELCADELNQTLVDRLRSEVMALETVYRDYNGTEGLKNYLRAWQQESKEVAFEDQYPMLQFAVAYRGLELFIEKLAGQNLIPPQKEGEDFVFADEEERNEIGMLQKAFRPFDELYKKRIQELEGTGYEVNAEAIEKVKKRTKLEQMTIPQLTSVVVECTNYNLSNFTLAQAVWQEVRRRINEKIK